MAHYMLLLHQGPGNMSDLPRDPEIHELLQQAQGQSPDVRRLAWEQLQRYRQEALSAARAALERPAKEALIAEARARLKERLRELLATLAPLDLPGPSTVSGSVEYVLRRVQLQEEHAAAVLDLRTRERQVWQEMLEREVQQGVLDGLLPRQARQAAENNLALRRKDLDKEVQAELERLDGILQRKLTVLVEELEDRGMEEL